MLQQRDEVVVTQVLAAARFASITLSRDNESLDALLAGAQQLPNSRAAIFRNDAWQVSGVGLSENDLPLELIDSVKSGNAARQRYVIRNEPVLAVGYPIALEPNVLFIGIVSMSELSRTLQLLANTLLAGSFLAILGGGTTGWWLSRRVMEPLHAIGEVAQEISQGNFSPVALAPKEPDLARIAHTFNEMTNSLSERIKREARFAATVSHELRSPLTVIRGAVDIIASRREELSDPVRLGLDLLDERVTSFEKVLNDLIEISRYEAGSAVANLETRCLHTLVITLCNRTGLDHHIVEVDEVDVVVDARRFRQIFENLVVNAHLYASDLTAIRSETHDDVVLLHFDDAGTGIAPSERERLMAPFERGAQHSGLPGSGLGLAITAEHARLMKGLLTISSSPEGGARFTLSLICSKDTE